MLGHLRMVQAPAQQILRGFRRLDQRLVIVIDHLPQHALVVGFGIEGHFKLHRLRGPLRHHTFHRSRERRMIGPQQFDRMTEADAPRLHHPVDDRAAGLARAETVPQILLRRHHERRRAVVMELTPPDPVRAMLLEFDPLRLNQPLQRDLLFQPVDLVVWDSRHSVGLLKTAHPGKTCQAGGSAFL